MKIFSYDDFEGRWYMRFPNPDATTRDIVANGINMWRDYYYVGLKGGDHEDLMIIQGVSVLRALFTTRILEMLDLVNVVTPDCVISYQAGKNTYVYTPADSANKATMQITTHEGWSFTVTVESEGR